MLPSSTSRFVVMFFLMMCASPLYSKAAASRKRSLSLSRRFQTPRWMCYTGRQDNNGVASEGSLPYVACGGAGNRRVGNDAGGGTGAKGAARDAVGASPRARPSHAARPRECHLPARRDAAAAGGGHR